MLRWAVIFLIIVLVAALFGLPALLRPPRESLNSSFSFPGDVPDLLHHRAVGRQKGHVVARPPLQGSQSNMTV